MIAVTMGQLDDEDLDVEVDVDVRTALADIFVLELLNRIVVILFETLCTFRGPLGNEILC